MAYKVGKSSFLVLIQAPWHQLTPCLLFGLSQSTYVSATESQDSVDNAIFQYEKTTGDQQRSVLKED